MSITLTDDHRYIRDGKEIPGLTRTLSEVGLVDTTWFNDYAAQRGSAVHRAIAFHLEGSLDEDSVDPVIRGYVDAAKKALDHLKIEPLVIEEPLYCARFNFGCTPDVCGYSINDVRVIVEWKTGQIDPVVGLQLAGQQLALEERLGMASFDRYAIKLNADGTFKLHSFTDGTDQDVWVAALALRNWKSNKGLL